MRTSKKMGKRVSLFFFATFLFLSQTTKAEVVINPHPIAGFQFSSKDMLNFDVVYTKDLPVKVQFSAVLQDAQGKPVVEYVSSTYTLQTGNNAFTPTNFNIAQTRWTNKTIAEVENSTKFLPSGDYSYCIYIRCVDALNTCKEVFNPELDYSACSEAHAEPITPLLLSFPEDEATIKEKRPNFTWIPPMPIGNNPNLTYTYTLVKMLNDQTAEDAIRRNRSLYTQSGIKNITLMFPNQLSDLEEGEHYAWQVSAQLGEQQIATSEVWEFEVEKEPVLPYVNINQTQLSTHICMDVLKVLYQNQYGKHTLNYTIQDENGSDITPKGLEFQIVQGDNHLDFPIDEANLEYEKLYYLIIENPKGKQFRMKFTYTSIERR
ncbi:MAG: DUF928 domain-containing protein [Flavobacteriales bacterium]|nr:DUF928 domain-containing protein [Flavobacteriales bacterium]